MGIAAIVLIAGSFYLGILLFRKYRKEGNSFILASALGLTIGSILTLIVAGKLGSLPQNAVAPEGVAQVPVLGWYLNGQDMRVPHFLRHT